MRLEINPGESLASAGFGQFCQIILEDVNDTCELAAWDIASNEALENFTHHPLKAFRGVVFILPRAPR